MRQTSQLPIPSSCMDDLTTAWIQPEEGWLFKDLSRVTESEEISLEAVR